MNFIVLRTYYLFYYTFCFSKTNETEIDLTRIEGDIRKYNFLKLENEINELDKRVSDSSKVQNNSKVSKEKTNLRNENCNFKDTVKTNNQTGNKISSPSVFNIKENIVPNIKEEYIDNNLYENKDTHPPDNSIKSSHHLLITDIIKEHDTYSDMLSILENIKCPNKLTNVKQDKNFKKDFDSKNNPTNIDLNILLLKNLNNLEEETSMEKDKEIWDILKYIDKEINNLRTTLLIQIDRVIRM